MKPFCNVISFGDLLSIGLVEAINNDYYKCTTATSEDHSNSHYYHPLVSRTRILKFIDEVIVKYLDSHRRKYGYRKTVVVFTCKVKHNKYLDCEPSDFKHSANSYYVIDETEMSGFRFQLTELNGLVEHFLKASTKTFRDKRNIRVSYPTLCFETMASVIKAAYSAKTCIESLKSILVDPNTFLSKKTYTTEAHITQFIIEQLGLRLGE